MNDRQHELENNLLAEKLATLNTAIEPYSKIIGIVVTLLIVGGIWLAFQNMNVSEQRSDSTYQLLMGNGDEVISKYPNTTAASWANLSQGNEYLAQGVGALFENREEAKTLLEQASSAFSDALKGSEGNRLVKSRANLGLAMVAESLGDVETAISHYKECAAAKESDDLVANAENRIESLSSASTKEFLDWFAKQDFTPAGPAMPPSLPDESGLPGTPDVSLPELNFGDDEDDGAEMKPIEGGMNLPKETPATESTESSEADTEKSTDADQSGDAAGDAETAETPAAEPDAPAEEKSAENTDPPADESADVAEEKEAKAAADSAAE